MWNNLRERNGQNNDEKNVVADMRHVLHMDILLGVPEFAYLHKFVGGVRDGDDAAFWDLTWKSLQGSNSVKVVGQTKSCVSPIKNRY